MSPHIHLKPYDIYLNGISIDDPYVLNILSQGQHPEPSFVNFIKSNFKDDSLVIFDIGANIGLTSLLMARLLPSAHIHAFEPGPNIHSLLKTNIMMNGLQNRITSIQAAVADSNGEAYFTENSAYGHFSSSGVETKVISAASYAESNGLTKIDFIKIDVEGFEPEVFQGLRMLDSKPIVYFEFNTWCLLAYGRHNPLEFLEGLQEHWDLYFINSPTELLPIRTGADVVNFAHETMVNRGCVSDCVATPKNTKINLQL